MAHELDTNAKTGKLAMFSVGETPWHGEGVVLNEAPDYATALGLAGCDYDVVVRPIFVSNGQGGVTASPMGRAIVRTDRSTTLSTDDVLSLVSDKYVPLQNRDAFGVLEPLLDKGVAKLETGGTLREGRDAWLMVRFDIKDPVVQEVFADEVVPFGLITNSHSGKRSVTIMQTPIRVVCANTLGAALARGEDAQQTVKVAHTGAARIKVVDAAEQVFGAIVERYRAIAESYALLKATRLTVDQFTFSVLDVAAPLPKALHTPAGDHLTTKGYDLAFEAATARRVAIENAWTGGKGHTGDHSAWEAYNAAVEVIDHDEKLFRTTGSRVAAMIAGRLVKAKTAVLNELVKISR